MTEPEIFRLTQGDISSGTWTRLKAFLVQQRDLLRVKNDQDLSDTETAAVRGEIRRLTALINLDQPPPQT